MQHGIWAAGAWSVSRDSDMRRVHTLQAMRAAPPASNERVGRCRPLCLYAQQLSGGHREAVLVSAMRMEHHEK